MSKMIISSVKYRYINKSYAIFYRCLSLHVIRLFLSTKKHVLHLENFKIWSPLWLECIGLEKVMIIIIRILNEL